MGSLKERLTEVFADKKEDGYLLKTKDRLSNKEGLKPKSVWYKPKYTSALGTKLISNL